MTQHTSSEQARAVLAVAFAYVWWGFSPLYFKLLVNIDAVEIIAHRIIWTLLLLFLIKRFWNLRNTYRRHLRSPRLALPFLFSSVFILSNWLIFTWAVIHDHVLETSLGYFINPLFNVLLGMVLLGERLRAWQTAAVGLATAGVLYLVWQHGELPLVALLCAITFSLYSLFRKRARIDAVNGLSLELTFGMPLGLGYLMWTFGHGTLQFGPAHPLDSLLLIIVGPVTMVPLLFFGYGAPRINLTTVGILQYVSPTLSFLLAVFAFGEPFDHAKLVAFVCIWLGLALYTYDSLVRARQGSARPEPVLPK